jgi:HEAT repeat protein
LAAVSDQTVSFLRKQLRPAVVPEPQRLAQWLADLSHDHYPVRTRAMQALAQLGEMAEPALKDALKRNPQYEARRRMERLLQQLAGPVTAPERLQLLRGVELLERIGTREAQRLLTELAKGTPQADLTQEAKASLARWRNDTR